MRFENCCHSSHSTRTSYLHELEVEDVLLGVLNTQRREDTVTAGVVKEQA